MRQGQRTSFARTERPPARSSIARRASLASAPSGPGNQLLQSLLLSSPATGVIQRACDLTVVGARTEPVFFPKDPKLVDVFSGGSNLAKGAREKVAVGLVQQALADVCKPPGTSGRSKDGVDRKFGGDTEKAVKDFQSSEAIPETGVVDKDTLRCLDETRSQQKVPCSGGPLTSSDLDVVFEKTGGRDEEIFFGRGQKDLDAGDKAKIKKVFDAHKDEDMTLVGMISEDERFDIGPSLADDRIAAVNAELSKLKHSKTRTPEPQADNEGAIDFWAFRKVVIVPASKTVKPPDCKVIPTGWTDPDQGPCQGGDETLFQDALKRGLELMDGALKELKKRDAAARKAVKDRFGRSLSVSGAIWKLEKWKRYLDTKVRTKHRCTNTCHDACFNTQAYSDPGVDMTTVCPPFLLRTPVDDQHALTLVHEAGHGALDTADVAYDETRLFSSIQSDRLVTLNTDSYVLLIECLNGLRCDPPAISDTVTDFTTAAQGSAAAEALAWLERWMDWVWQDVNNLYEDLAGSRKAGRWGRDAAGSEATMALIAKHFAIHRPRGSVPGTRAEQIAVAAIHDRLFRMMKSTEINVARDIRLDSSASAAEAWNDTPPPEVILAPSFVTRSRRKKVERLVELLVAAQPDISSSAAPAYVKFVIEDSQTWFKKP